VAHKASETYLSGADMIFSEKCEEKGSQQGKKRLMSLKVLLSSNYQVQ
jgi:hypothetical protein